MTQNKRFIIQERCVVDTNDNETFEFSFKVDAEIICEKLNKIEKENGELKTKVDFYKYFQKDARKLEKENEWLKSELKIYRKVANCSNCIYQNYNWFEDGDEFEICERGNNEQQISYHICEDWREL